MSNITEVTSATCTLQKPVNQIKFKLMSDHAYMPRLHSSNGVGMTLVTPYLYELPAKGIVEIKTDLKVLEFPPGCYGRLVTPPDLVKEGFISIQPDFISPDDRSEIRIFMVNHSCGRDYTICPRMTVAHLICERYTLPDRFHVELMSGVSINFDRQAVLSKLKSDPEITPSS